MGCAVRQVYRDASVGVIALPANTNKWPFRYRDKAHRMMGEQFPQGYAVISEGEEVVGQSTNYDETNQGSVEFCDGLISIGSGTYSATTTDEHEYRIHYRGK